MKESYKVKLSKREAKIPNTIIYKIICKLIAPFVMRSYGTQNINRIDDINAEKGPKFVIYNHQSRFDWVMITKATYPAKINFVAGYNEFFRKKFNLIFKLMHTIPKKNFTTDIPSIKAMNTIIKKGGVVCFSPEGMSSITGYNQPIVPGTGKFLKHYGIPVYVLKSRGAYLVNHKVCLDNRKGHVDCDFYRLFTKEDLEKYTADEIQAKINEVIWQDDYEWNKTQHNKYLLNGNGCSHMDDLIYYCPKCGKEFSICAEGNTIKCTNCGNEATLDDYYDFHITKDSVIPESLSKWVELQRGLEIKRIRSDKNYEFVVDNCTLGEIPDYKLLTNDKTSEECGKGKVTINHQGFFFDGVRNNKPFSFKLTYDTFTSLVIVTTCSAFGIYLDGEFLEITPPTKSVGKMLLLVEEFARFHYNTWPNFPWMNHLYEE